jgi:hypothetical protein
VHNADARICNNAEEKIPQGINPSILILEKTVIPPTGIEPQHIVTVKASYSEITNHRYTEVSIVPDNITIPAQEAH